MAGAFEIAGSVWEPLIGLEIAGDSIASKTASNMIGESRGRGSDGYL